MEKLRNRGFSSVGNWSLSPDEYLDFSAAQSASGLYAFIENNEVRYIGVTERPYRQRLNDFRYGNRGQKTMHRVNKLLKKSLQNGSRISIWVSPRASDTDKAPENSKKSLLREFKPEWNRQGKD